MAISFVKFRQGVFFLATLLSLSSGFAAECEDVGANGIWTNTYRQQRIQIDQRGCEVKVRDFDSYTRGPTSGIIEWDLEIGSAKTIPRKYSEYLKYDRLRADRSNPDPGINFDAIETGTVSIERPFTSENSKFVFVSVSIPYGLGLVQARGTFEVKIGYAVLKIYDINVTGLGTTASDFISWAWRAFNVMELTKTELFRR